ncbi:hypothetical protein ILYODFUR_000975 [Ilyodon furcidens]|uniref:Uncharacterized protein n=1 Tax=Ilyodon furcidens TaxID=33524 RepID=A0ABV0U4F1_9TELE
MLGNELEFFIRRSDLVDVRFSLNSTQPVLPSQPPEENESNHCPVTDDLVQWCDGSYLQLNANKIKDKINDFRRKPHHHEVTVIKGHAIERLL